jgi:hypothetical protein
LTFLEFVDPNRGSDLLTNDQREKVEKFQQRLNIPAPEKPNFIVNQNQNLTLKNSIDALIKLLFQAFRPSSEKHIQAQIKASLRSLSSK